MAKPRRRLAAILSADVVGFSRLMELDEADTVRSLKACRAVFAEHIERDRGRLVDASGDALLAEFPSAVDAVECSARVQAELARRSQDRPSERRMLFRIGANLGEVVDDGQTVFGDGVNVAARLQALAEPGGLCVSGKVFDEIDGRTSLSFESAGESRLKNISAPVRVYRWRPAPRLRIRVLGELEVWRGDGRVDLPQSKKTRALLAYLVVTARPQRRDRLCGLLWDVADDPRAALRWSLSKLRPLVDDAEARRIDASGPTVRFEAAGAHVDLAMVRERIRIADDLDVDDLVGIAREFRGPFLEGLELPDFLEFRSWCVAIREESRSLHARTLTMLIERLAADPAAALPHARALAQIEPFEEAAHATLVRLLVESGRPREAEEHLRSATALLRQVEPGAGGALARALREARATSRTRVETDDIAPDGAEARSAAGTRVGPGSGIAAAPAGARPPEPPPVDLPAPLVLVPAPGELVGRREEFHRLTAMLAAVEGRQRLGAVLLLGEPGIGKTRLLAELMQEVERRHGTVLDGSAYEAESGRAYGPWVDALRRLPQSAIGEFLGNELALLLPELGGEPAGESSRDRLFGAVVELLAARAHSAPPVLVVLDDVQWCDGASAELLHYVARMNRHRPLLLALAGRDGELQDNESMRRVLRGMRHDGVLDEIELSGLDREGVARLVGDSVSDQDASRVFAESAGNPLFALEVARSLPHRRADVPATLRRLVRDRVDRLPADGIDVLRWAAVVGHAFDAGRLGLLAAIGPDRLVGALESLERFGMIRALPAGHRHAGAYGFAHDIVRQVVYAELSEPRRRLMHARVAQVLQEQGGTAEDGAVELAHHASEAGDAGTAARACLLAARRCLAIFAGSEADALARRGMHHAQALGEPDRVKFLLELAEVRYAARRPQDPQGVSIEVEGLARAALALGCTEHARLGFHVAGYLRWEGGNWSDAQRHMLQAAQIGRRTDGRERALALGEAARCLALLERDLGQAEALVHEAEGLSSELDFEPAAIPDAIGMLRLHEGRLDEAAQHFAHARELCRREKDRLEEFRTLEHLVMVEIQRERFAEAHRLSQELVTLGERLREGSEAPFARVLSALSRHASSSDAGDELEAGLVELRVADAKQRLAWALTRIAEIDTRRGHPARARERAAEALRLARVLDRPSDIVLARAALVRAAMLAGDGETAARERAELGPDLLRGVSAHARLAVENLEPPRGRARRAREK